jgi:CRP-like cAMP-binding protein
MTDFLEEKRREIQARLKELKPLVDEYHRLEAAERALAGVPSSNGTASPRSASARSRPTRARSSSPSSSSGSGTGTGTGRRGRPKGSGQRAQQALEQIRNQPGITIPELAEKMGIKQNYLYRVVPDLQEQGLVSKSGRGWHIRQ